MSGQLGQPRTLPFTGLAAMPVAIIGLVLSAVGFVLTRLRPAHSTD
ncbi:MAG TPA: hypothetical protein VHC67_04055 [Gaiellaceae bacterium]|jgi:hypothetical protein|nr:hypothetical protein [Gaiellaceae bacterium]